MDNDELLGRIADLELELEAAYRKHDEELQTRERHALEMVADIAQGAAWGNTIPSLEKARLEFGLFCERIGGKKGINTTTLHVCLDALDDIIAGRMDSTRLSVSEFRELNPELSHRELVREYHKYIKGENK